MGSRVCEKSNTLIRLIYMEETYIPVEGESSIEPIKLGNANDVKGYFIGSSIFAIISLLIYV